MTKTKIIIAGIGGVGGYFGGVLAKHFEKSNTVEISFVARGEHLKQIQQNGLRVIKGKEEFIANPAIATNKPDEIGKVDYIILCTKSYDLESILEQLKPCIHTNTVILPLLNGVDSRERIMHFFPDQLVADGCVYIVSRLIQAGVIENSGNIQSLYFGLDNFTDERLILLENLLKQAGIEATLSQNISSIIWEKFIFISAIATATSYFDLPIGGLVSDKLKLDVVKLLLAEVKQIADGKNIIIASDIIEKNVNKLKALPFETTSSMHSDFKNRKEHNELESLTGYVVREAQKMHIPTPTFNKLYTELSIGIRS